MKYLQIAIDGPVAAGKGDIAIWLARELHLVYIYTGAMYRALALACIQRSISTTNAKGVIGVLPVIKIELVDPDDDSNLGYKVLLDSKDVTQRIFKQDTAMGASDVSVIPEVRSYMVRRQQQLVVDKNVVMEGRDIGLRVLPKEDLKIFLTASPEVRAKRRHLQWEKQGVAKTYKETLADTETRDDQDTKRTTDPLQKLPDAWELDTTYMTQEQVVSAIINKLKEKKLL